MAKAQLQATSMALRTFFMMPHANINKSQTPSKRFQAAFRMFQMACKTSQINSRRFHAISRIFHVLTEPGNGTKNGMIEMKGKKC